jgi:HNH endonuclease
MSVYISVALQTQIREHFYYCCAYCQTAEALTAMTFEFEHIVPRSQGGATVFDNLCFACPFCNRHKSDRQQLRDPESGERVELFHPHQQQWSEHFCWSADQTELIGLTPIGRAIIDTLQMNRAALVRSRRMWVRLGEHPPA